MKIQIELTPDQIANAIVNQDYPQQAQAFDAIGAAIKRESEDEDKYYRWTRYLIEGMDADGRRLIRDLATALNDSKL